MEQEGQNIREGMDKVRIDSEERVYMDALYPMRMTQNYNYTAPTSSRRVPEVEKIVEQPEEELEMLKKKH